MDEVHNVRWFHEQRPFNLWISIKDGRVFSHASGHPTKQVSGQSLPAFGEIFRLLPIAVIFLLIPAALAQEFRATVTGTVTDESGAQIAGARVEVKNLATGLTVNSVTNTDGSYTTPSLEPGKYSITVTTSGFKLDFIHQAGIAESLGQVLE